MGLPVDKSWKLIITGEHPAKGLPVKFATGACAETDEKEKKSKEAAIKWLRIL